MKLSHKDYNELSKKSAPSSKLGKNVFFAFLIGGGICTLGQALTELYKTWGLSETTAPIVTSVSLVFLSAVLTGLALYDDIAKVAGAGTLVPITGFANAMVSPAIEFKAEGLILGLGAKMFAIAGPVIVYGISSSVIYGIIVFLFHLY